MSNEVLAQRLREHAARLAKRGDNLFPRAGVPPRRVHRYEFTEGSGEVVPRRVGEAARHRETVLAETLVDLANGHRLVAGA